MCKLGHKKHIHTNGQTLERWRHKMLGRNRHKNNEIKSNNTNSRKADLAAISAKLK